MEAIPKGLKYHYAYSLHQQDPTIDGPTELHIELGNPSTSPDHDTKSGLIAAIDRSIVNGLRRVLLQEVKTRGFAKNILIPETYLDPNDIIQRGNLTIFNGEHLSDRIGMVPIHDYVSSMGTSKEEDSNYIPPPIRLEDEKDWVFRICDPIDPNLPLKHLDDGDIFNRQYHVKVQNIRVFKRLKPSSIIAGTDITGAAIVTHSKDKMAQVSSKINYIFLDRDEYMEMGDDFKKLIFKYPELILLSLKKGEGVFAEMIVEVGKGGVINPNAMLPEQNSHARWISAIPDYRFKMEKEFSPDYDREEQIANSLINLSLDRELAPILSSVNLNTITLKKVRDYQENIDQSGFFPPNSPELAAEKELLVKRITSLESQIEEDRAKVALLDARRIPSSKSHNPVEDQKNYRRALDPILRRYDNPERYMFDITYNGHLWPQDVWVDAISVLIDKVDKFRYIVNNIQDVSSRVTERAAVQFDPNIPDKLEILIDDDVDIESHTLGNLIKCHFIYLLDHIIEHLYPNRYSDAWAHCFSNYKIDHPLKPDLYMTFKTPGGEFPLFPGTGLYALRHDGITPLFSELHDRETNETVRLLKITCDQLIWRLNDLLAEAKLLAVANPPPTS